MTQLETREVADRSGKWFVIYEGDDVDDAQTSGRWIKTTDAVTVAQ